MPRATTLLASNRHLASWYTPRLLTPVQHPGRRARPRHHYWTEYDGGNTTKTRAKGTLLLIHVSLMPEEDTVEFYDADVGCWLACSDGGQAVIWQKGKTSNFTVFEHSANCG